MTDRFLDNRRNFNYKFRSAISEGINGFHKTHDGQVRFIATTFKAAQAECDYRNAIYNLTRKETVIEEGY